MRSKSLLIIFLLALFPVFTSLISAQPKMYIAETTFDFGFSPQNCKVSHVFWLKSVGGDTLKIVDVKPG